MGKLLVSGSVQSTNKLFVGSSSNEETSPGVGIHVWDIRDGTITPNSFGEQSINFYFDQEVDGDWKSIMHIKGWTGDYAAWQIAAQASNSATESNSLYFRTGIESSWNSWHTLLDNKNYTSYTVTKTGSGASGTWGINVTGSAGSVAWGNVTGKPSTFTPSSHTHDYQPIESTTFSITNTQYVSVRTPNRTAAMYYEFWDGVGWAGIRAGDIYDNNNRVLSTGNYTSYTVTKTGSGASGTWGINISGQAGSVYGPYSGNGGNQIPSYIGTNTTKFAMMRNFGSSDIGGYMDCILMNNYGWSDVPYATGLGITKVNGYPRAIIANGPKTGWAYATELLTSYNYSWWALPLSGGTMTGKLQVNNIIFGYNYTQNNNAPAFVWDKPGSYYTGMGASGTDTIKFGPVESNGTFTWVNGFAQHWVFQGTIRPGCIILTNDQWTGYGTSDPNDLNLDKVVGRLYFKI